MTNVINISNDSTFKICQFFFSFFFVLLCFFFFFFLWVFFFFCLFVLFCFVFTRPVARIDFGRGGGDPQNVDLFNPKSGLFELNLLQTPCLPILWLKVNPLADLGLRRTPAPLATKGLGFIDKSSSVHQRRLSLKIS